MPYALVAMTDEPPWRILRFRVPYENDWIRVTHHDVLTPGGSDGVYGVVHYKNLAIGIIPIDQDDARAYLR